MAARACITPTECGQQIVDGGPALVGGARGGAGRRCWPAGSRLTSRDAQSRDTQARGRLTAAARQQLRVHRERLARKGSSIGRAAPDRLASSAARVRAHAARLGPLSLGHLGRQDERVQSWRRLLAAYDVERQLERGYSLTLTADGQLVRSVGGLAEQQEIVTRFADGTVRSRVEAIEAGGETMTVPDEPVPVEQLSFTEASRELDSIVNFFEQREVDVDVLVGRLERATALIDELDQRLRRTQAQVEELVPRLDALAA